MVVPKAQHLYLRKSTENFLFADGSASSSFHGPRKSDHNSNPHILYPGAWQHFATNCIWQLEIEL